MKTTGFATLRPFRYALQVFCVASLLLYPAFLGSIGCAPKKEQGELTESAREYFAIKLNEYPIQVEIADTPQKQQKGLMFRKSLGQDKGMLFIFDEVRHVSFWMKNTLIPSRYWIFH